MRVIPSNKPHSKSNNNSKARSNQSSRKDSPTNRSIHFPLIPDLSRSSENTRSTTPRDNQCQQPSETTTTASSASGRPMRQKRLPQYLRDYQT